MEPEHSARTHTHHAQCHVRHVIDAGSHRSTSACRVCAQCAQCSVNNHQPQHGLSRVRCTMARAARIDRSASCRGHCLARLALCCHACNTHCHARRATCAWHSMIDTGRIDRSRAAHACNHAPTDRARASVTLCMRRGLASIDRHRPLLALALLRVQHLTQLDLTQLDLTQLDLTQLD